MHRVGQATTGELLQSAGDLLRPCRQQGILSHKGTGILQERPPWRLRILLSLLGCAILRRAWVSVRFLSVVPTAVADIESATFKAAPNDPDLPAHLNTRSPQCALLLRP